MTMKLDIVLRIHDGKNIHSGVRYLNVSKKTLILGCLSSLINSANLVNNTKIFFFILNDHCSDECIEEVHKIFKYSKHKYTIVNLEEPGFRYSGFKQFEFCKNSTADLVYSVEDDYLHATEAIQEMLWTYDHVKSYYKIEKELCIYPFDNPEDYEYGHVESGDVYRTPTRHWRQGMYTTFTMMTPPKVFQEYWDTFEKLALEYKPWDGTENLDEIVCEGNTISNIWANYVVRINPIPSLALHVQFERQRDPHIDIYEWWNKYSKIKMMMTYK